MTAAPRTRLAVRTVVAAALLAWAATGFAQAGGPRAGGPDKFSQKELIAFGEGLAKATAAKGDWVKSEADALLAEFKRGSDGRDKAIKAKLLPDDPTDEQVYALATSVWAELRAGPSKYISNPNMPLPPKAISQFNLANLVLVKFKATNAGAEVYIDKVHRGTTEVERFLTKGQQYKVEFHRAGKTDAQDFTPKKNPDECKGNI